MPVVRTRKIIDDGGADSVIAAATAKADENGSRVVIAVVDPGGENGFGVTRAVAGRALDGDVGQVLDVEVNVAEPAAGRALPLPGVEREMPWLPAPAPGVRGVGEQATDLVERPGVGGGRRPRVLADRRGVNLHDLADAAEVEAADVPGQRGPGQLRPGGRDEAVQDQGGLPRP